MAAEILNGEDLHFFNLSVNENESKFCKTIGHIEEILIDEEFLKKHEHFMEKYWTEFNETEENKFCYTDIFREYGETVEKHIEEELVKRIADFDMSKFEVELQNRKDELDLEIFELFTTFTDFISFKMMFLDYKAMKEGKTVDISVDLHISKYYVDTNSK